MKKLTSTLLLAVAAAAFAGAGLAQQYKWVDKDGRVRYGDTPPPGVKAQALKPPPGPATPAGKAPPTAAEKEAEFRKRQAEARKGEEKAELARKQEADKKENCERAHEHLRTIDSGQRMSRMDAKGERVFLDDNQRAEERVKAVRAVKEWCGG